MNTPPEGYRAAFQGPKNTGGLPTELVEQAARRLGLASLVYAITFATAFYPAQIIAFSSGLAPTGYAPVDQIAAALSIGASLLIFVVTRWVPLPPRTILDFGLVYEVVASFGIAISELWRVDFTQQLEISDAGGHPWFGISWVCVWILIFPIIVPSTPGKALLSSFAAASMAPLALLLTQAFGGTPPVPAIVWMGLSIATFACATMAYVTSRFIYGLGRDIREAREMGSYRLIECLGKGGMGEVWSAEHRLLARPAAIKLIRRDRAAAGLDSSETQRRFEREARITAMLRSPHTVQLYDFGVADDGSFYYVMELLDGLNLEVFVERFGPVPPARTILWLRQACASLAEAHQLGLVHRDIKPANLYVGRVGTEVDFIKVLDFGLVKPKVDNDETRLTIEGIAAGTPSFMAPEMAEGLGTVDQRADIYALGCVAYWLLTGELVFEGGSPVKTIVEHVRTPPVPPSQRIEAPIPEALEAIVLQCLEKAPDRRPQTARELAELLEGLGIEGEWQNAEAHEWWDRHLPERV